MGSPRRYVFPAGVIKPLQLVIGIYSDGHGKVKAQVTSDYIGRVGLEPGQLNSD